MGREQFLAISWRDLGGLRGRDRDFRNDRWSSCVWLSGYAQAETRILVAPPSHLELLPAMDRGRKVQRLAFQGYERVEHCKEILIFLKGKL